jgi:mono/diheme cytochrome c family protein
MMCAFGDAETWRRLGEGMTSKLRINVLVLAAAAAAFVVPPTVLTAADGPGDPVKGEQVYAAQKCSVCHKINGKGGPSGPDLSTIGVKRDAAWLAKYLPNPAVLDPKKPPKIKMTPTKAKGQDLDDLIAYLLTLKVKK